MKRFIYHSILLIGFCSATCFITSSRTIAQTREMPRQSVNRVPGLNCVLTSYGIDPNNRSYGEVLIFSNECGQAVYVKWLIGRDIPSGWTIQSGATFYTSHSRARMSGSLTVYTCPADHPVAVDAKGLQIFSPVAQFECEGR